MKIYSHWVFDKNDQLEKRFFATKGEEEQANKQAAAEGKQAIARHDWNVDPTAKAFAKFCNEQLHLKEYEDHPTATTNVNDELGDLY